jgi:hypothetical protein
MFINNDIQYRIRDDIGTMIPHIYESIFIEVTHYHQTVLNTRYVVGVIYRPNTPPRADTNIFSNTLCETMDIINRENKKAVILGDMNIDLLKYNSLNYVNEFVDNIVARSFVPKILKPTRVSNTSATLIDHIYTNDHHNVSNSGIVVNDVADHFGVFLTLSHTYKQTDSKLAFKRVFSTNNINHFNNILQQVDFSDVIAESCPEASYDCFHRKFSEKFNIAFPLVKVKHNRNYIKKEKWITSGLLTSLRTKNKLYRKKINNPSDTNIEKYKKFLNKYNKIKREMKRSYFDSKLNEVKNDIKATWNVIREVVHHKNISANMPQYFDINGSPISDKVIIANDFNKFFANIGKVTHESILQSQRSYTMSF